jgi:dUTP pyrophosphatase
MKAKDIYKTERIINMLYTILFIIGFIGLIISLTIATVYMTLMNLPTAKIEFYTDEKYSYLYNKLPKRATKGSAGFDIFLPRNTTIPAKSIATIDTNIKVKIPDGYVMNIYPRSSIGIKKHLMLANTVGVIDSDFNDTIKLAIYNYGYDTVTLNAGERIAQAVTTRYITDGKEVHTVRDGGIGSTGR